MDAITHEQKLYVNAGPGESSDDVVFEAKT